MEDGTTMSQTPDTQTLNVKCACCGQRLGWLSEAGWTWLGKPARLANRRRFLAECNATGDLEGDRFVADVDNFRMRTSERKPGEPVFRIWEFPYLCDRDECLDGLGPEWTPGLRGEKYVLMPAGKTAC